MFEFSKNNQNHYELIKEEFLGDLNSTGLLLRHKKSGARVMILSNEDENKVFSIGFRTPPYNDTGLQHILEHSVLCGSRKYPVKDPFVELCKGSLNTFLNAMTYPDKTVYPVASCNLADFKNIMDVYMDAVFYPNIYERPEIFMQEGWHYAMDSEDEPLEYNGVVYNEMKGVYSSPEEILSRYTFASLFPDTAYVFESGGDPEVIPTLTYEEFLDYHKAYYHPSNSYIYLYGDMDVNERLEYLDKEYLKDFDVLEKDTSLQCQAPFEKPVEMRREYAVTPEESLENNTYLAYSWAVGSALDAKLSLAMKVLDYVLITSTGGVLKEALIKRGIGTDIDSTYENSVLQPMYSVIARNTNEGRREEFLTILRETLEGLVRDGIDEEQLLAGLNYYEFRYREADFGPYPKGLMYGLQAFDSWLYDDSEPFMHIASGEVFAFLRQAYKNGYFEGLIQKYLLDNAHASLITLAPRAGLTEEKEEQTAQKLQRYKNTMTQEEIQSVVSRTKALEAYQEEPSTQEALETIPMLTLEDMKKEAAPLYNEEKQAGGVPLIHHNLFTNQIDYIMLAFDCRNVPEELVPYLGVLTAVLGEMNTQNYSYAQLSNVINMHSGGFSSSAAIYTDGVDFQKYTLMFEAKIKVLREKAAFAFEIFREILFTTRFADYDRLRELIARVKSRLETAMTEGGHTVAMMEAMAQFSPSGYYSNKVQGYDFYGLIEQLDRDFDNQKEKIAGNLGQLVDYIVRRDNLKISFTANEESVKEAGPFMEAFVASLPKESLAVMEREFVPGHERMGLTSSSQVQYVARCGNYVKDGYSYTGALRVLKVIFSYEYLWLNVRVKGGAYGCMSGFYRNGDTYFVSYRDPNLAKTNKIYEAAPEYIRNFSVSKRDMLKFIIGTIGALDTPLNPAAKGMRSFGAYISRVTMETFQKERDEILGVTQNDIRNLAPLIESVMKQNYFCAVGNAKHIQSEQALFDRIENLIV